MKRLNVKLTIWLVSVTLITLVGVHLLHAYQVDRNAGELKLQAEKAVQENETQAAIDYYSQYLKYRDDPDGYSALAKLVLALAQDAEATKQIRYRAYNVLQEAIRKHPELTEVRRRLVDFSYQLGQVPETLEHIKVLQQGGMKEPDLDLRMAQCYLAQGDIDKALRKLQEMVGIDEATGQYKEERTAGASETSAYVMMAQMHLRKGEREKADAAIAKMVEMNPDSARAHLNRAVYIAGTTGMKNAKEEIDAAYKLTPDDPDVLLMIGSYAMTVDKDYDRAQEHFQHARELFPKRQDVYLRLKDLAVVQNDVKRGIEYLEQGLKSCTDVSELLQNLVNLQFQVNDLDGVEATCKRMEAARFRQEFVNFQRARLKLVRNDVVAAAREFEALRPALVRSVNPGIVNQLDVFLGVCYETLGQPDRQLEVYRRLLQSAPSIAQARLGEASALQALGRHDESTADLELLLTGAEENPFMQGTLMQLLANNESQKPPEKRNWNSVERVAEMVYANPNRTELDNDLLKAQLMMLQNRPDAAQSVLTALRTKNPKDARVWSALIKLLYVQGRADRVGTLLDLAEQQLGQNSMLFSERINMLAGQGGDEAKNKEVKTKLAELEKQVAKYPEADWGSLYSQLGTSYFQVKDYESVKRCWQLVAKLNPKNSQIRQGLFELALANHDPEGIDSTLAEIQNQPDLGSQSVLYKYCAAMRLIYPLQERQLQGRVAWSEADHRTLADARKLIDESLAVRAEWSPLWRVRGEIEQLEGRNDAAILAYQKSLAINKSGQTAVARRLVQLLYASRRYDECSAALASVGALSAGDPLNKISQDMQRIMGNVDVALDAARKDIDVDPKNPVNHLFYGQLLASSGKSAEAEAEFRLAVQNGPQLPQAWDTLVRHLVSNQKTADAHQVIREAVAALPKNPRALARLYHYVNELPAAEEYYTAAVAQNPDDVAVMQDLVEFFVTSNQSQKSRPHLEKLIARAKAGKDEASWQRLTWGRRALAGIIAEPRDYQSIVAASKVIEENAKDGKLATEDMQALVDLLSSRPELDSRTRAIKLLESLKQQRPLVAREEFALGQLYDRAGNWSRGKDLMLSAISRDAGSADMGLAFCQLLYRHQEYEDAQRRLNMLEELLSQATSKDSDRQRRLAKDLRARVLIKLGRPREAVGMLESLVPNPLPPTELQRLAEVSRSLEDMEQYEPAERMLRQYVSLDPRGNLAMGGFLGRRGEIDKAFEAFDQARKSQPAEDILAVSLDAVRRHPQKTTPARFAQMEEWARQGLENNPGSIPIRLMMAEVYDLSNRMPDTLRTYRELLSDKTTTGIQRALVQNNLAYQLAVTGGAESASEALQHVEESIKVIGPTSDLLDTRGLVYAAMAELPKALADLSAAASDSPSVAKYIHLGQAQVLGKDFEGARESLAKAEKLGVDPSQLTPVDRKGYNELTQRLK